MSGFLTALVIFALRQQGASLAWYGAVGLVAVAANLCGALVAPWARRHGAELRLIAASSLLVGVTGVAVTQFPDGRRRPAALLLVVVVGLAASVAKTATDAIVQEQIPPHQRVTFFARLEALLQTGWVLGALIPTLTVIALLPGYIVVTTVVLLSGAVAILRTPGMHRPQRSSSPHGPPSHQPPLRQVS
jgi:MFS family permease